MRSSVLLVPVLWTKAMVGLVLGVFFWSLLMGARHTLMRGLIPGLYSQLVGRRSAKPWLNVVWVVRFHHSAVDFLQSIIGQI